MVSQTEEMLFQTQAGFISKYNSVHFAHNNLRIFEYGKPLVTGRENELKVGIPSYMHACCYF